jgi:hypothetical protein
VKQRKRIRIQKEIQKLPINLATLIGTKFPCQAKSGQFYYSTSCNKCISRLQISMEDLKEYEGEKTLE